MSKKIETAGNVIYLPQVDAGALREQMQKVQKVVKEYLVEGVDYGTIPGTNNKDNLLKPGAEKLIQIWGLTPAYKLTNRREDWDRTRFDVSAPLFDYEFESTFTRQDGTIAGIGYGSANSYESKWLYRNSSRQCPQCGKATIIKGKAEFGGGWLCWKKEGKSDGCGAKFAETDPAITNQPVGKMISEDIPTQKNTILKIAKKRSMMDGVLSATGLSMLFTQDLEDGQTELASVGFVSAPYPNYDTQSMPQPVEQPAPFVSSGPAPVPIAAQNPVTAAGNAAAPAGNMQQPAATPNQGNLPAPADAPQPISGYQEPAPNVVPPSMQAAPAPTPVQNAETPAPQSPPTGGSTATARPGCEALGLILQAAVAAGWSQQDANNRLVAMLTEWGVNVNDIFNSWTQEHVENACAWFALNKAA